MFAFKRPSGTRIKKAADKASNIKMDGNEDECTCEVTYMINEGASESIAKTVISSQNNLNN